MQENTAAAVSATLADAVTAVLLFPLDVVKTHLQTDSNATVTSIVTERGLAGLFAGVSDKLISSPQQKAQYFYVENSLLAFFQSWAKRKPSTWEHLVIGYLAALQGNITTIPLDVTLVRRIASRKKRSGGGEREASFWASFQETVNKDGFWSFYKGWVVSAILCFNPAITFVAFERIKDWIVSSRPNKSLSSAEAFFTGALAKAIATWITFPFIRAKVVVNTWSKLHNGEPAPSLVEVMEQLYAKNGVPGLFTGIAPQLSKGLLNSAIMLMLKERIDVAVSKFVKAAA